MRRKLVDYLVKHVIKPFGIPRGSEKQGGQHQNTNSPVLWPVDFVTALVVDGKVINLVNFWKHDDINAGDDLMMYVEDRPYNEYVLSHHPKCMKKQVFPILDSWEMPASLAEYGKEGHISTEGEDMLKRLWDLLSELSSIQSVSDNKDRNKPPPNNRTRYPTMLAEHSVQGSFDRTGMNQTQVKDTWRHFDQNIGGLRPDGVGSPADLAFGSRQPAAMGDPYDTSSPSKCAVNMLPDESFNNLKSILFDSADINEINNFIMQVGGYMDCLRVCFVSAEACSKLTAFLCCRSSSFLHSTG